MTSPGWDLRRVREHVLARAQIAPQLFFEAPRGQPTRLKAGPLTHVWRVPLRGRSVILKVAHAHAPEAAPSAQARVSFEALALEHRAGGDERVTVPRLLDFDPQHAALMMEDLGPLPELSAALGDVSQARVACDAVGQSIGRLHRTTRGDASLQARFTNAGLQREHLALRYNGVGTWLKAAGVEDAEALTARAGELAERLTGPGRCLVMGDLQPRAVLLDAERPALIGWELAHFGHPAQDLAQMEAHLWMTHHRAPDSATRRAAMEAREALVVAWRGEQPIPEADRAAFEADRAAHFGVELLAHTLGSLQPTGPYDGMSLDDDPLRGAVEVAAQALRGALPPLLD